MDQLQSTLKLINISESAIPVYRGRIVENTFEDTYFKVEKMLNNPAMEQSHPFLYGLDFNQLSREEIEKVDKLYELASDQDVDPTKSEDQENPDQAEVPTEEEKQEEPIEQTPVCYTCFYSAIKNGSIKTGECYSNTPTPELAKADAVKKLSDLGFSGINIIAIETGDPDFANQEKPTEEEQEDQPISEAQENQVDELTKQEKLDLFSKFFKIFKALIFRMGVSSYIDLDLDQKAEFWELMAQLWTEKYDPREFMTQDNIDRLETMKF